MSFKVRNPKCLNLLINYILASTSSFKKMISTLVEQKSNRILLKDSDYHGFSEVFIFEAEINYLICNECHSCIKKNEKMINLLDHHKANCKSKKYPKKPTTLDVHKLCFSKGFELKFFALSFLLIIHYIENTQFDC